MEEVSKCLKIGLDLLKRCVWHVEKYIKEIQAIIWKQGSTIDH